MRWTASRWSRDRAGARRDLRGRIVSRQWSRRKQSGGSCRTCRVDSSGNGRAAPLGLLDLGARDHEQANGPPIGDLSVSRAEQKEETVSRRLHERLEIHCGWNARVGAGMDRSRVAQERRSHSKSRAVARGGRRGKRARVPVELGSRSRWPSAKRIREFSRADRCGRANELGWTRAVEFR